MSTRQVRWLLQQLPQWQREGVLDADSAERLRQRYAESAQSSGGWLLPTAGGLLVGLGLILLIAHNWDQLSRPLRLALAIVPLTLSQLACVHALRRHADVTAWREVPAVLTALSFAAALALVGQIYHLPGDLPRYLLICTVLSWPLIYLMRSVGVTLWVAAGWLGWSSAVPEVQAHPLLVIAAFATLLPLSRLRWFQARGRAATAVFMLLIPLFYLAVLLSLPSDWRTVLSWTAGLGAVMLALQRQGPLEGPTSLVGWGYVGVCIASLWASFGGVWSSRHGWLERSDSIGWEPSMVLLMLLVGVLAGLVLALRRRDGLLALLCLPGVLLPLLATIQTAPLAAGIAVLFNGLILAIGSLTVREGLHRQALGLVNAGLGLMAILVALRFFDNDWSFTVRGIGFVLVGSGFLLAHGWLKRRVRP